MDTFWHNVHLLFKVFPKTLKRTFQKLWTFQKILKLTVTKT